MEHVDLERMRQVLDRVYPQEEPHRGRPPEEHRPPPPEHRPPTESPACRLLETERRLHGLLRQVSQRSAACRRVLRPIEQHSARRERKMLTGCFLAAGAGAPHPLGPRQGREGVLFALRRIAGLLEELSERYEQAAQESPGKGEMYRFFSGECRSDAQTVEKLLERALR